MISLNPFDNNEDDGGTVFRDAVLLFLMGFVVIVLILLPYLNPDKKNQDVESKTPGNVIVEIRWPDDIDADVDLWVQGPGDVPVGYSNKGGKLFNLLRDDLGNQNDATKLNYENSYSRGIVPGEYIVNVHGYRFRSGIKSVKVIVVVSVKLDKNSSARQILTSTVTIKESQELTVFRFRLTKDGKIVPGSVNNIQKYIRSASVN